MNFVILPTSLRWPTALSLAFLVVALWLDARSLIPVYHCIMLGLVLPMVHMYRQRLARQLSSLPFGSFWRIILLGYMAVVFEETLVGALHALQEGGEWGALPIRIGQFIFFNLFAFTGLIFGMAFLHRLTRFGRFDLFLLCGLWGVFAEGLIFKLPGSPIVASLLLIPTMAVYALIMLPGQLSAPQPDHQKQWPLPLRLIVGLTLFWILSIMPMLAATTLRDSHPALFPPCAYIPCG